MSQLVFTSNGMRHIENTVKRLFDHQFMPDGDITYVGWGRKKSGERAMQEAQKNQSPFALVEDGFLRCVKRDDLPLSLVFDDKGIYYDAKNPSRLETLIPAVLNQAQINRAELLAKAWMKLRLSKYNEAREYEGDLPEKYVLVLDQTFGDSSIESGLATAESFQQMLDAAIDENPNTAIVLKIHPDIYTKNKKAHFQVDTIAKLDNVIVIAENCHPVKLIEQSEKVYTVTSQVGFEALIWGKPVRCFGMPFYAGWGLTEDELNVPARRSNVTLNQLIHAALVAYPRYIDPEAGLACEVERVMGYLGLQRKMRQRFPKHVYALGFSRWKKPLLQSFLSGSDITFVKKSKAIPKGATVVLWGNKTPCKFPETVKCFRIEDGFLRSAGLGAELIKPLSWVIDQDGLYYDASKASSLEIILRDHDADEHSRQRAKDLRERIVALGISKYNLSGNAWKKPVTDKPVILVPGQVESDLSIAFGSAEIKQNIALLRAVRETRPNAYIVYKPHPDVVAGLRKAGAQEDSAKRWCDDIVTDSDAVNMLSQVDEVHTLTSLIGFEALMREIPVTCYGNPFYAGWGLTSDIFPLDRRTKAVDLDALVYAVLIAYPTYVSNTTNLFTTPERIVDELIEWKEKGVSTMPLMRRVKRGFMKLVNAVRNV